MHHLSRKRNASDAAAGTPLPAFLQLLYQCIGGDAGVRDSLERGISERRAFPFGGDHPDHSLEVNEFRVSYLWQNIMSKYFDPRDPSLSKKSLYDAAIEKLHEAEAHCALQPVRWSSRDTDPAYSLLRWQVSGDAVLSTAARKISRVLGRFNWEKAFDGVDFGPGATTNAPRSMSDAFHKFGTVIPECSTECVPLVEAYLESSRPLWKGFLLDKFGRLYSIQDANRITTVPKNYKTDRPIAIEPLWNLWFQKGIGSLIRRRLMRVGIDLRDQTVNRNLALEGSRTNCLATIDLSSASDTVSYWLVERLLPPDWLEALEQCRSRYGVLDSGKRILYRKFSSMGNGYTFELESLIFWAITSSVVDAVAEIHGATDRRVSVYGDDIICPSYAYDHVTQALQLFGFMPNKKKSYGDGPFRESCGIHAYRGHDVTPFYIRRPLEHITDVFLLYNNLTRWSTRRYSGARDGAVVPALDFLRELVPDEWRKPRIPDGFGDGAFIGSFDEVCPVSTRSLQEKRGSRRREYPLGWCGWATGVCLVPRITERPRRLSGKAKRLIAKADEFQRLLKSLHVLHKSTPGAEDRVRRLTVLGNNSLDTVEIRPDLILQTPGSVVWSRKRLLVHSWTELGPFINFDIDQESSHE